MGLGLGLGLNKPKGLIYFQNQFSMEFDGVDDRIITDDADTVVQNSTYSFWCKASETGENKGVFGHGTYYRGAFHFNYSSNKPRLYYGGGFYVEWDDTSAQDDGEWHHWVVYVDINTLSNSKLYCDGVLQTGKIVTTGGVLADYTQSLTIGSDAQTGSNSFLGQIDEFAVFDRELTQAEITRMYNTYYTNNLIQNSNFDEIGPEEITNGDFSQIGNEEVTNGDFSQIGSEEITNGDFSNGSTDWNIEDVWTVADGVANGNGANGSSQEITQSNNFTTGKSYKIVYDVLNYVSGSIRFSISGGATITGTTRNSNGTFTQYIVATANHTNFKFRGTDFYGSITNVSVKEVGQDWTFGTDITIENEKAFFNDSAYPQAIEQTNIATIGKQYKVSFTVSDFQSGTVKLRHPFEVSGVQADGDYVFYGEAASTGITLRGDGVPNNFKIDNISVKEVGQHWTFGTGWSTDGTKAIAGSGSDGNFLYSAQALVIGKTYKVSFSAIVSSGTVRVYSGGFPGLEVSSTSSFTGSFVAAATQFGFYSSGFDGSIDNISVKEVAQHWTLTNGWSVDDTKATNDGTGGQIYPTSNNWASGATIKFQITVSDRTTGHIRIQNPSSTIYYQNNINTNNTFEYSFTTIDADGWRIEAVSGFDGSIDNIVVQQLKHSATNLLVNSGDYQSANPLITSTKSMEFDGTDEYLSSTGRDFGTDNVSVACWVNLDAWDNYDGIWSNRNNTGTNIGFQCRTDGVVGNVALFSDFGSSTVTSTATGLSTGKWHYVVCTMDRSGNQIIYVDGVAKSTDDISSHSAISMSNVDLPFFIGKDQGAAEADGNITEFGIWDRVLTDLEVASLYNQGMPTNLLVNRNDYQSGNPTVFNTKQVDFDGVDDYMELGSHSATSSFTYSAWVKYESGGMSILRYGQTLIRFQSATVLNVWSDINGAKTDVTINNAANIWSHLVITQTGNTLNVYQDGILKGTNGSAASVSTTAADSYIGKYSGSAWFFNGQMSQIGIWNEVLTADEVSSLYNHGLPIDLSTDQAAYESSSNLVGYWRMGGGTLDTYPLIADQTNATLGSNTLTGNNSTFDTGIGNWYQYNGASLTHNNTLKALEVTLLSLESGARIDNTYVNGQVGKTYKISADIWRGTTTDTLLKIFIGNVQTDVTISDTQTNYVVYLTTSSTAGLFIYRAGSGNAGTFYIDNVKVEEVQGNPAIMTNQTSSDIENGSPYANIVQNGTFDSTDNWATPTGWDISDGKLKGTNVNAISSTQSSIDFVGKTFKVVFTISDYVQGDARIYLGGSQTTSNRSGNGTYTEDVTITSGNTLIYIQGINNFTGSIDNVTVSEVNTGLQGYWKMGDGTNDEYPVIYDQTNPDLGSELVVNGDFAISGTPSTDTYSLGWYSNTANVSITNGTLILTNSALVSSSRAYITDGVSSTNALTINKFYKLQYDVVANNGVSVLNYYVGGSGYDAPLTVGTHIIYFESGSNQIFQFRNRTTDSNIVFDNVSIKDVQGNPATMTNMVEGNITNQFPLTKIRNYYRMGDGDLDGYPIIQDQTSRNLATIPTTNLLTYSENFSLAWQTNDSQMVLASSITDPFGTQNSYKLQTLSCTNQSYSNVTLTTVVGKKYTFSAYAKKGDYDYVSLVGLNPVTIHYFNLANGTATSSGGVTPRIYNVGNDWFRCEVTLECDNTSKFFGIYLAGDDGNISLGAVADSNGLYVTAAQIEEQSQATAYIKSDGIAAVRKATTTNLIDYSEDFSQANQLQNVTLTANAITSPIGTSNGTKVLSSDNNSKVSYTGLNFVAGTIYTVSVFCKNIDATSLNLFVYMGGAGGDITYNFTSQVNTSDWTRVSRTFVATGTNSQGQVQFARNLLNGQSAYFWGFQFEQQTQAETYAKTTGLPVTIDLFTENNYGTMTNMSASDIVIDTPGVS